MDMSKTLMDISKSVGNIEGQLEHVATKDDLTKTESKISAAVLKHANECEIRRGSIIPKTVTAVGTSRVDWAAVAKIIGLIAAAVGGTLAGNAAIQ